MTASAPDANVDRLIRRASILSAALGVVLSPIPLADELLLLPIYGVMTARIARQRGLAAKGIPWRPVMATAAAGLAARAAVNVTVSYIPGVAAFANAVSAVALTQFFGRYVDGACKDPGGARAFSVKEILASLRKTRVDGGQGAT
jgi:uncharacterized protein (DUF697 family)